MCPHFIHTQARARTHTRTHYFNRCQMGNVLDIQFTFGDANVAASPSCSRSPEQGLQQLLRSRAPAKAGGTMAPGLGVTCFVAEEQCQLGHVLGAPVDLGRGKQPKSVPPPSARRHFCRWEKDTAQGSTLRGGSQPPFSEGSLWGIEGLLCTSNPACFSPTPADLFPPSMVWTAGTGDTSADQEQG